MVVRPSVRINVENSGIRTLESCDSSGAKEEFRRLKSAQALHAHAFGKCLDFSLSILFYFV